MDNSNRIAELEERKRQIDVEIAFEKGFRIEGKAKNWDSWSDINNPEFKWITCDYRIKEEPKRIPFDESDAFGLVGKKVMPIGNDSVFRIVLDADKNGIFFRNTFVSYEELSRLYLVFNKLSDKFEPCNKVA